MPKLTIDVQQSDIDLAIEKRTRFKISYKPSMDCPIANAVQRIRGCEYVQVGVGLLSGFKDGCPCVFLPTEAKKFAKAFDTGEDVKPFTFEVDIP